jgi:hypothetical protein
VATGTSAITVSVASAEDIVITLQLVGIVSRYFKRKGAGANYNLGGVTGLRDRNVLPYFRKSANAPRKHWLSSQNGPQNIMRRREDAFSIKALQVVASITACRLLSAER